MIYAFFANGPLTHPNYMSLDESFFSVISKVLFLSFEPARSDCTDNQLSRARSSAHIPQRHHTRADFVVHHTMPTLSTVDMQSVNITTSTTLSSRPAGAFRFLLLSDTHDTAFPEDIPPADVVLHCGDITMIGGLSNYKAAISSLSNCPAELKLVIPATTMCLLTPHGG